MTATPQEVKAGDVVHFLRSGLLHHVIVGTRLVTEISRRGAELTITQQMIENLGDRNGRSWLEYIHNPERQIDRWGYVAVAPGPAPEGLTPWTPDSPEQDMERDRRRAAAWATTDPQARAKALREVDKAFGRASTSKTLKSVRGGER